MSPSSHHGIVGQVQAAVDTALVKVLTVDAAAMPRVRSQVQHALGLLVQIDGDQAIIVHDAADVIRAADEHLNAGRWQEARCALVTARGRLARPGARYTGTTSPTDNPTPE
ncbi:hypothetical protein [Saccharopolyspora sp. ASAGF58]|uniref:hypothetical protein n=1 Tax=Saccharopolyspora sp. ASAGF58 TaxID=2719023 RepID=UPI0014401CF1|nr:hypothetical protein [Saccharopolyspora sp. ASAGF58]QIZ38578.1 hypothetical protein FDZ84_33680 [Saccharopolyspora sp. ASAGF58]